MPDAPVRERTRMAHAIGWAVLLAAYLGVVAVARDSFILSFWGLSGDGRTFDAYQFMGTTRGEYYAPVLGSAPLAILVMAALWRMLAARVQGRAASVAVGVASTVCGLVVARMIFGAVPLAENAVAAVGTGLIAACLVAGRKLAATLVACVVVDAIGYFVHGSGSPSAADVAWMVSGVVAFTPAAFMILRFTRNPENAAKERRWQTTAVDWVWGLAPGTVLVAGALPPLVDVHPYGIPPASLGALVLVFVVTRRFRRRDSKFASVLVLGAGALLVIATAGIAFATGYYHAEFAYITTPVIALVMLAGVVHAWRSVGVAEPATSTSTSTNREVGS